MARTKNPAPDAARSAADAATNPAPVPVAPAAGDSPAAAVLAALSAEPAGAAVAVIAGHAGISTAAARQALLAREERHRHPGQGQPARHRRHLDALGTQGADQGPGDEGDGEEGDGEEGDGDSAPAA